MRNAHSIHMGAIFFFASLLLTANASSAECLMSGDPTENGLLQISRENESHFEVVEAPEIILGLVERVPGMCDFSLFSRSASGEEQVLFELSISANFPVLVRANTESHTVSWEGCLVEQMKRSVGFEFPTVARLEIQSSSGFGFRDGAFCTGGHVDLLDASQSINVIQLQRSYLNFVILPPSN